LTGRLGSWTTRWPVTGSRCGGAEVTDATTETSTASDAPPGAPAGDRLDSLESKVDGIVDTLKRILGQDAAPAEAAEPEPEVDAKAQMKQALKELAAEEKAAAGRKSKADADLDAKVEEKVAAKIREKPPKEYRKVTNLVWGKDDS
jgi:hypothetical protein